MSNKAAHFLGYALSSLCGFLGYLVYLQLAPETLKFKSFETNFSTIFLAIGRGGTHLSQYAGVMCGRYARRRPPVYFQNRQLEAILWENSPTVSKTSSRGRLRRGQDRTRSYPHQLSYRTLYTHRTHLYRLHQRIPRLLQGLYRRTRRH